MKQADPLRILNVIDELHVGPVKVEKRRLVAPHAVVQKGTRHTSELMFRYAEEVFDPQDPADVNLANMIAAQVALNYGLFCGRIVFHGTFDAVDRRFLRDMAENTAREIYVKKLLEPNPFLKAEAARLPIVKQNRYLRAELIFESFSSRERITWEPSNSNRNKIAVLSSGGKDSLLSYGLLNELGYEVHPIFGNESGRHWFTALNAYRHFHENVANTTRVWMTSDRMFAWMLRRLPFIRPDFAQLRSDEYPIRLWTVAVFLFGALPLVRKRGAARLVIGDEHDTSARTTYHGITHYDGLYDQSRYFDNALSRYYAKKSWPLSQFSLLRPLSELMIERVLVQRYPNLFAHQMSCHAATTVGKRAYPCGKCEKCRRIVGMVLANGGDPTRCGYTKQQIDLCLDALVTQGVHQERSGAEQLMWMLEEREVVRLRGKSKHAAKQRREILKLRFDGEKSPPDSIPADIRAPLYRILLEHADGAVRRMGRLWEDVDLLNDPAINRPYPFERRDRRRKSPSRSAARSSMHSLAEMTWPEAKKRFKETDVALLPVGSIEQHGPHLPLDTDAFDAEYLATSVAKACSDPKPIVFPLISYGVSYHHDDFSGTISIGNQTLASMVYEIGMSAAKNGITKLVIINGHAGNTPALNFAAQQINRDARIFVCVDTGETSDVDIESMTETFNDVHAGEIETSTSLATRPELVRMEFAEKLVPEFSSHYLNFTSKRAISWHAFTKRISDSGVMGDPTRASAEKGKKMWDAMVKHLVAFVEDLKKLSLDEIFQKRY
ncbi:MAG: creatininase family protein [Candidatus Latescibacteria bacterium]|nr:creatininase family protein [Candidatus Latescibacterota bacterium]NIO55214.1 creatininase family protein [Candidatus Latescibacterota bacterium]